MVAAQLRIFISVAEDSADVHAASLIKAARQRWPECRFYGLTGPRMRAVGAETVFDFTSRAAMLAGAAGVIGHAWQALRAAEQAWRQQRPDLVVLLDSPELNLRLARRARRLGLPVLYYIAPQTWATREYRNRQIARDVDRLACILPFEQRYFRRRLIWAEYVGHPLFEALKDQPPDEALVRKLRGPGTPLIALLPGSRRHVIEAMLPRQLEIVHRLRAWRTDIRAAISCVGPRQLDRVRRLRAATGVPADILVADNAGLLTAADLALVASGTATLEVAYYRKPMVVMYDAGRLLKWPYRLGGRLLLKTPHLSLVNILAGARVVPEFMPFVRDLGAVAAVAAKLLTDHTWRTLMCEQLGRVVAPLLASRASEKVCQMIEDLTRCTVRRTSGTGVGRYQCRADRHIVARACETPASGS